jgi:RND family efflux transporter MFP subunit
VKQQISEDINFVGTIAANSDINIVSETQGKATAVYFRIGEHVSAGTVLVQVDDELKRAAYELAEANLLKAKKDHERLKNLFETHSTTEAQVDQAKLAVAMAENQLTVTRRQLNDTKITAPVSGVLTSRLVEPGTMIQPGTPIANLVDISRLKVKVNVSENDAFKLRELENVTVTSDVFPQDKFPGSITAISVKGDEAHTYPIEVSVQNNGGKLRSGMFARVHFASLNRSEILAVPRIAVMGSGQDTKVYIVEDGIAKIRPVVLGTEFGSSVEILAGIAEGATVVINGQNTLMDDVKVTIVQ